MYRQRNSGNIQNPHVSVDCAIFGFDENDLKVLLIERGYDIQSRTDKHKGELLLPGDLINDNETLDEAAQRVLFELTGLEHIYLEQFKAFGNPDRVKQKGDTEWLASMRQDPAARVITIAYFSLVKLENYNPKASSFAREAGWYSIKKIPNLGFDHNQIVKDALLTLQEKIKTHPIGFELLPKKFTLGQLQKLYETILDEKLDKRNFRRQFMNKAFLKPLLEKQKDVPHKRAQLFEFDRTAMRGKKL